MNGTNSSSDSKLRLNRNEVFNLLKQMNRDGVRLGQLIVAILMYIVTIHAAGFAIMLLSLTIIPEPSASIEEVSSIVIDLAYTVSITLPMGITLFYLSLRNWKHYPWKNHT